MRALIVSAALLGAAGCDYYAYELVGGRNTGCGGIHFTCGEETATDSRTGFMWLRKRRLSTDFINAKEQCQSLRLEGQVDWRLPTLAEYQALEERFFADDGYHLDPEVFPMNGSLPYFSSDTIDDSLVKGWSFHDGDSGLMAADPTLPNCIPPPMPAGEAKLHVSCDAFFLCVRGGAAK